MEPELCPLSTMVSKQCQPQTIQVQVLLESLFSILLSTYQEQTCWVIWLSVQLFEGSPNCFPQRQHHFTLPPATYEVLISLRLRQRLFFLIFLITAILVGTEWYLTMVLIYISEDVGHLFVFLLAFCIHSLGKSLFKSFVHF